ncbi:MULTISPECIES: hypothetical protein [Enterococcus]|uniref:Phage tail protein n=1 Tax=Enterococcus alishanensis TaxID=1303817 RepID=A0ABS6TEE9_9ENTE|nr:hypothetical protein [Enterococcus alishanensis]MBV7391274.1 hypothetical protein [Enterococcus alishanensis]
MEAIIINGSEGLADPKLVTNNGNYVPTGWTYNKGDGDKEMVFGTTIFTKSATFKVKDWRKRNYTVIRYSDGNKTELQENTKDFDEELQLSGNFEKAGYTLSSWKDTDGKIYPMNGLFSADGVSDGATIELFAQWKRKPVTLTKNKLIVSLPTDSSYDGQSRSASDGSYHDSS